MDFLSKNIPLNRSLLLAGGGVRLAYHAGVLMALEEAGLQFNHVDGASGGIFGTAMLASGITPKDCAARWRRLNLSGFVSMLPVEDYFSKPKMAAMGGSDGIRKKIYPSLGIDEGKIRGNHSFDATFNVCNFSKKTVEVMTNSNVTTDHLVAGMSLPVFMPGVKIGDDWYSDAVWIKDTNITEALRRNAEEIILVWCIGNAHDYLHGFFNQYVHMIEMSANGGVFEEMETMKQLNVLRIQQGLKSISLTVIKPKYPLPLDPDFFLGKINADTLINMGYADTKETLARVQPFDWNHIPSSTAMENPGTVLHFRQQFFGEAVLNDTRKKMQCNFSVFIYETKPAAQLFASVMMGDDVISTFNNCIHVDGRNLDLDFDFLSEQKIIHIHAVIKMHAKMDFLLGMDAKKAAFEFESGGKKSASTFIQPASNRVKNAWQMNVRSERGTFGRMQQRNELLNFLFNPSAHD